MDKLGEILKNHPSGTHQPKSFEETPELKVEQRHELRLRALGVTDLNNTFENMRLPPGFERTFKAFKEIASGKTNWYMLLVYGGTGNGKSKCCEATVLELTKRYIYTKRWRWSDIVRHLKALMGTPEYEKYFNELRSKPHLIIDDVGSGSTLGNWEWGELEDIVDYRLEQRLMTIITTNLDGKAIPARIISRFKDKRKARLILNEAADQRPEEK